MYKYCLLVYNDKYKPRHALFIEAEDSLEFCIYFGIIINKAKNTTIKKSNRSLLFDRRLCFKLHAKCNLLYSFNCKAFKANK